MKDKQIKSMNTKKKKKKTENINKKINAYFCALPDPPQRNL